MKRNTKRRREKKLEQLVISVIFALLLVIISYIAVPEENKEQKSNQATNTVTQTNSNIAIADIPAYSGKIVIDINTVSFLQSAACWKIPIVSKLTPEVNVEIPSLTLWMECSRHWSH